MMATKYTKGTKEEHEGWFFFVSFVIFVAIF